MIPPRITAAFPADVRSRGERYYSSRNVRIARSGPTGLTAFVTGTTGYIVELRAEPDLLTASCTCPYAADHGICKHIWATLRYADSAGRLERLLSTSGPHPALSTLRDDDDASSSMDRQRRPPLAPHARAASAPEWKTFLDAARRQMAYLPPLDAAAACHVARRPAHRLHRRPLRHLARRGHRHRTGDGATETRRHVGCARRRSESPPTRGSRCPIRSTVRLRKCSSARRRRIRTAPPARTSGFVLRGAGARDHAAPHVRDGPLSRARTRDGERPVDAVALRRRAAVAVSPPRRAQGRRRIASWTPCSAAATTRCRSQEPTMLHSEGLLLARGSFARFDHGGAFALVSLFREKPSVRVPESELPALIESLYTLPRRPALELPPDAQITEVRDAAAIRRLDPSGSEPVAQHASSSRAVLRSTARVRIDAEHARGVDLRSRHAHRAPSRPRAGARGARAAGRARREGGVELDRWRPSASSIHANKLNRLVVGSRHRGLARRSRRRGVSRRRPGARVGDVGHRLVRARRGRALRRHRGVAARSARRATPRRDDDRAVRRQPRHHPGRLARAPRADRRRRHARRRRRCAIRVLKQRCSTRCSPRSPRPTSTRRSPRRAPSCARFDRVAPVDPPRTFRGTLREYQREGLGWLHFLRTFGLGGCLADDMGLGKTVQVLALLDARRGTPDKPARPSIVVVPRSLVFNWLREAERFTPQLRVLDSLRRRPPASKPSTARTSTSSSRPTARCGATSRSSPTSPSTTRSSTRRRRSRRASSASAKAARLLRADHRLAMTGTPIENRLEELWSLFEFLNPGMLGASSSFAALARLADPGAGGRRARRARPRAAAGDPASHQGPGGHATSRRASSRRCTSSSRARSASSTTICSSRTAGACCERVDRVGVGKARMHILEALLRLRQAACHPALADPRKHGAPSAKLDALIPALEEVVAEGHKALVFSQFTSFLALLRERLDDERRSVRVPRRPRARPSGARRPVPERSGVSALSDQSQGRRARAQPHGGGLRVHSRSVVESGGRSAGDRPRASHRSDAAA